MKTIRAKEVASYVLLPGIIPRVKELFSTGSGMLASMVASIFVVTGLLPRTHAYANPVNIRKFGVWDAFSEARRHLVFDRKHMDQVAVFVLMSSAFVIFIMQFALLAVSFIITKARAQIFETTNNTTDIAFELMDRVFGIPDVFDSCVAQRVACGTQPAVLQFPSQANLALQGLLQFYSTGLLLMAVLIFLYYIVVVLAETAQTGTPFGRRFSHIWTPIRLVVALGLLIPLTNGLNGGQYIVLYAAKTGSGLATNGWNLFTRNLDNGLGVQNSSLIARPKVPDAWPLVKFVFMAKACQMSYENSGVTDIKPYLRKQVLQYTEVTAGFPYQQALDFYNKGDIIVTFGKPGDDYMGDIGSVRPFCGEITFPTTVAQQDMQAAGDAYQEAAFDVQKAYFDLVMSLWHLPGLGAQDFARVINSKYIGNSNVTCQAGNLTSGIGGISCDNIQTAFVSTVRSNFQAMLDGLVVNARDQLIAGINLRIPDVVRNRGWAGAGIWYNLIAVINGTFFGAVSSMPIPAVMPRPMELVRESRRGTDQNLNIEDMFRPNTTGPNAITLDAPDDTTAKVLHQAYLILGNDDAYTNSSSSSKANVFKDTINLLFGTTGLFNMRENSDIHPLAQLVGVGKSMMDATVRNLFTATVFSAGGGFMSIMKGASGGLGGFMDVAASILKSVTMISLTIGFLLYYVLPFLPFMYFFFAVGAWLKTIFEAMVGVPLWALGHLRIDGHGLPGEQAVQGYYMIFEIFVRPILTVFGLIGGLICFTALAKVLNETFNLVTDNLSGFDPTPCAPQAGGGCTAQANSPAGLMEFKRDVIDQFFFTCIYTIIIYMMATSSFKMIDQIPANIMRWMGAGIAVFAKNVQDPEEGMTKYLAYGAASMTGKMTEATTVGARGIGGLSAQLLGRSGSTNLTGRGP